MENTEILKILKSAQPYYSEMDNVYQEIVSIDMEKANCKRGLSGGEIALGIVLMIFLYCIPGIIYLCVKSKKNKRQYQDKIMALENQKQILLTKAENIMHNLLNTGINELYQPEIWTNTTDMNYIYSYFVSGRADTVKESLNLLAEEKHRFRMEGMQSEMLSLQHKTNQQLFWGNMINTATALEVGQIRRKF